MFTDIPMNIKLIIEVLRWKNVIKLFENGHSVNSDKEKNIEKWKREREKNKMNEYLIKKENKKNKKYKPTVTQK